MTSSSDAAQPDLTGLLQAWSDGDETAGEELMGAVYRELRLMAARSLRAERAGHTLDSGALVHEAFMRLFSGGTIAWESRMHFFGLAARSMRQILVDHARRQGRRKRGGDFIRIPMEEVTPQTKDRAVELVALDAALDELARRDPRKAQIVELRYFGGFQVQEIAEHLGISVPTVNRHWRSARAWLQSRLRVAS